MTNIFIKICCYTHSYSYFKSFLAFPYSYYEIDKDYKHDKDQE